MHSGASWVRYIELALGYLGFLVLVVYPVAVATTWLRLMDTFHYEVAYAPATSLYAVSLMPKTAIVAGTGVGLLYYSLFSGGVAFLAASAAGMYRLDEVLQQGDELRNELLQPGDGSEQGSEIPRGWIPRGWKRFMLKYAQFFALAGIAPLLPFGFSSNFALESRHDYALYALYLVASILGGLIGSYVAIPRTLEGTLEEPRWRGFAGAAVIYVGIIVGAVSLVGVTPLTLPNVQFGPQAGVEEGSLLAHSEGYWYVLTDKEILAIPDDAGGEIRITEPLPYGPQPSTECPYP
jgi:hypothetical protein